MPVVYVNGFAMSYRDAGGTGPPVIFVHGGFPSLATLFDEGPDDWEPWEAEVVAKFRLITFYRRGYHPSSCPKEGCSIDNQATDIAGLLDALAIEQAHLIGSSSGGPIAYCFAAHYPSRSRSLVLAGTGLNLRRTLRDRPDVRRLVLDEVEALRRYGPRSASSRRATVFAVSFEPVFMSEEFAERGQSREYEARLQQARERLVLCLRSNWT